MGGSFLAALLAILASLASASFASVAPRSPAARRAAVPSLSLSPSTQLEPIAVVEDILQALQKGEVRSCFDLSSAKMRREQGPRVRCHVSNPRLLPASPSLAFSLSLSLLPSLSPVDADLYFARCFE